MFLLISYRHPPRQLQALAYAEVGVEEVQSTILDSVSEGAASFWGPECNRTKWASP